MLFDFKEFTWLIKSHLAVACKRQTCLGYMQIWNSSLSGFSVVKHLYSLEMTLYCYEELRRNILDF